MIGVDLHAPYKTCTGTADCRMRTADYVYGLGIKHELRHKERTKHYGLGIKRGLRNKMRTVFGHL